MRTRSRSRSRPRQRLKKSNPLGGRLRSRSRPRATPKSKLVVQSYNTKTAKKFKDDDEDENEEEQEETSEEENEPLRGQQKVRNPLTGRMIIVSKKPTSTYQLTLLNPAARDILLHDKLAESKDIQMHQVHHIGTRGRSRSKMIVKKKKNKKEEKGDSNNKLSDADMELQVDNQLVRKLPPAGIRARPEQGSWSEEARTMDRSKLPPGCLLAPPTKYPVCDSKGQLSCKGVYAARRLARINAIRNNNGLAKRVEPIAQQLAEKYCPPMR